MAVVKKHEKRTYLTFQLADEIFAIDVLNVFEVFEYTTVTKIPGVPEYVRGIVNLRGRVVPVVDLRLKFGMPESVKTKNTCVIVLDIGDGGNEAIIGAVADSVKEVFEFADGQIEPPPKIGTLSGTEFLQGIGKREDQFIVILDINRVFSSEEVVLLETASGEHLTEEVEETEAVEIESGAA